MSCIIRAAVVLCFWAGVAYADVPQLINYQGRLADSAGKPVTAVKPMVFRFYDAETGGNVLGGFAETQNVAVTRGIFTVLIGSATIDGVPVGIFSGPSVFLSVTVDGEELSPRQQITTVGYAFKAAEADHAATATQADHAGTAGHAATADEATTAVSAQTAVEAQHAATAGHAASADTAQTAANLADASVLDSRFLKKSGDLMLGSLTLSTGLNYGLNFQPHYGGDAGDFAYLRYYPSERGATAMNLDLGCGNDATDRIQLLAPGGVYLPSGGLDVEGTVVSPEIWGNDITAGNSISAQSISAWNYCFATSLTVQDAEVQRNLVVNGSFVGNLAPGIVRADSLAAGAVTGTAVADGSLTGADIADGSITEAKIADGSITGGKIANGTVTTVDLADGSVSSVKLAPESVSGATVMDGSLTAVDLKPGSLTGSILAAATVGARELAAAYTDGSAFDGRFVKKTGGTMTGGLTVPSVTDGDNPGFTVDPSGVSIVNDLIVAGTLTAVIPSFDSKYVMKESSEPQTFSGILCNTKNADYLDPRAISGGWGAIASQVFCSRYYYGPDSDAIIYVGDANPVHMRGNLSTPIIYDLDNSGYYLNPASTSVLGTVRADYYVDRNNTAYYVNPDGTSHMNEVQAKVYVDSDNTSYYVDPAGTSKMAEITAGSCQTATTFQFATKGGTASLFVKDGKLFFQDPAGEVSQISP